ncbi:MAG TPA: hypothetical protein EYH11_01795 [Sulfurimonas autotrophica]|nr:hypothetical protein [Sulfurimonas autotrophica]
MKNIQIGSHFFYFFFKRLLLFFIIWLVLTEANIASLWIGIPSVIFIAFISMTLNPPVSWSFTAFMKFILFYLFHAFAGGIDVMRRVFSPSLAINPGLLQYHLYIPKGVAQEMIVNVLNLLPGTLSVNLENNLLLIHVLDVEKNIAKEVALIEKYIHSIFNNKAQEKRTAYEKV